MSPFWHDLLVPGVSVLEKIVRPIVVYLFLVGGLRLAGKRELAQLNPVDLVVLLTLSNAVQNAIIGDDNSVTGGLLGAAVLLAANWLAVTLLFRHPRVRAVVEGDPEVLVTDGQVDTERLVAEKITPEELEAAARKQGFDSLAEVHRAILYPGGTFAFTRQGKDPDLLQHDEVMTELRALRAAVAALAAGRVAPGGTGPAPASP